MRANHPNQWNRCSAIGFHCCLLTAEEGWNWGLWVQFLIWCGAVIIDMLSIVLLAFFVLALIRYSSQNLLLLAFPHQLLSPWLFALICSSYCFFPFGSNHHPISTVSVSTAFLHCSYTAPTLMPGFPGTCFLQSVFSSVFHPTSYPSCIQVTLQLFPFHGA